jgi:hypothetical protein
MISAKVATVSGGFILGVAWIGSGTGPTINASTAGLSNDYSNMANWFGHANGTGPAQAAT